ncbi:hypothetical protein, variant 3 [Aphanomyces invadans]|uniref:Uncharacterized protein n=1 Tax=Aphanomyces invadans TaxID=157072 RepID=A0A024TKG5_9STRA|nr:hypothetical protein, variant 2 [Aphanomyces invadans]XP_008876842.1 hypothetical protein, variant 3 [Aphanomyces invadans]ETV94527.1 hypothetical protein, variant 2 [Aphanomyces invadans]ETV94528.1 hypothetical protein, variant 3 [Aphanomyces invadans]|eukprot:XP_008876840.1 hypothetical protein, variant 2 [Aphanomyces invadans]
MRTRMDANACASDLSYNRIQSISVQSSDPGEVPLLHLNLSHNAFATSSAILLPGTVQTLDLSGNRIGTLSREMAEQMPRQLKSLVLSGNGMTSIDGRYLPTTLKRLDLTRNSIETILLDTPSYALVSHPEFVLEIEPNQAPIPTSLLCMQPPPRLANNYMCVIETPKHAMVTAILGKYLLGLIVVVLIGYAAFQSLKQYQSSSGVSELTDRSTYISSNYLEQPKTSSSNRVAVA